MKRIILIFCMVMTMNMEAKQPVIKKVLANGLTVLVRPVNTSQKVAVELWYGVGSKDEKTGERGLAHLLEHMIFKGTKQLSETDIQVVTHKLGGDCNAFTMPDCTCYVFHIPVDNWKHTLPILADCMRNCTFKQEHLNSEFKVVIQELKMYRDNWGRSLGKKLLSTIFADHPYHYPTIGFKQDLWNVYSEDLHAFYQKHYIPNNAALVVVGNVDPQEVFSLAEQHFGAIAADPKYKKETFYRNEELTNHLVTLHRDVKLPQLMVSYLIPGYGERNDYVVQALQTLLGDGKSSRLYRTLVDELQLVNWISCFTWQLQDHDLLFIYCEPKLQEDIDRVAAVINQTLNELATTGPDEQELAKVMVQIQRSYYAMLEQNAEQATAIGYSFVTRKDENYPFKFLHNDVVQLAHDIKQFISHYCSLPQQHRGVIVPLDDQGKARWQQVQQQSDAEDVAFLAQRVRTCEVEAPNYAQKLTVEEPGLLKLVYPQEYTLANGLKVVTAERQDVPLVHISLDLKATAEYDNEQLPGLHRMMCMLMYEGTQQHPDGSFAQALESLGIELAISPGHIEMSTIKAHLPQALSLFHELLTQCTFTPAALSKIKDMARAEYRRYLDSPAEIARQLAREAVYQGHPYSKLPYATPEVIERITREDILNAYQNYITPHHARMVMVGDFDTEALKPTIEETVGRWQGPVAQELFYPALNATQAQQIVHQMNRDQVVLRYAGSSIDRKHPDFLPLAIFDQIFGAGMHSRLFALREQHGIFYSISGSTLAGAGLQPGMVAIAMITSPEHVGTAQSLVSKTLQTVIDSIEDHEVESAKQTLLNEPADWYSTNRSIAGTFHMLSRYELPYDYVHQRAREIKAITPAQVREAARRWLRAENLVTVHVGRVQTPVREKVAEEVAVA